MNHSKPKPHCMSAFDEFDVCRNILESLLTGGCVVDMQKKIVLWSDGAERITGHLRHEVIGRSCVGKAVLHCQQPGCEFCSEECPLASAIKTAHPVEASGFLQHKSGYEVPVRICAIPVHNPHGSIIGAVETFDELEQNDLHSTEKSLPGSVDDVTGVASRAQTTSHLREALAAFTERQVAFVVLPFGCKVWITSAPLSDRTPLRPCCGSSLDPLRVTCGEQTLSVVGPTMSSL